MSTTEIVTKLDRLDVWFREFERQAYEVKQNDIARIAYNKNTQAYLQLKAELKRLGGEWWN